MILPAKFADWPAAAKIEHWEAYQAQDGSRIPYKQRLILATNIVRERHLRAAAEQSEAVKHGD